MSTENSDLIVDAERGLVLRKDPFGGNENELVDFLNSDQWEILEEDFGPVIDWPTSPIVAGKLVAQKIVQIDHDDDRGESDTNIYCMEDALSGERRAFYGNYQIDNSLGCNPPEQGKTSPYLGRDIVIKWEGKREQGKGGRTLNIYTIAVRRAPVAQEEPF